MTWLYQCNPAITFFRNPLYAKNVPAEKLNCIFIIFDLLYLKITPDTINFKRYSEHCNSKNIGLNSILIYGSRWNVLHSHTPFKFQLIPTNQYQ